MKALRRSSTLTLWIASFAILAAALLPGLAQALARGTGQDWVMVCTAKGMRMLSVGVNGQVQDQGAPTPEHNERCPFCSLGDPVAPLPEAPAHAVPAPAPRTLDQAPIGHPIPAPQGWRAAMPRAPPAC